MKKSLLFLATTIAAISITGCSTTTNIDSSKINNSPSVTAQPTVDWNAQVKTIATKDASTTEKFDEVTMLARKYTVRKEQLKEFEKYILDEYKQGNYLKDISNDEYMLSNIFISTVVERHYDDKDALPIDRFAFDFLQNTKYTYRGADTVDSDSVKSNEEQMNKAIESIK
ncbi:hypothetical protein [Paenibacillus gorillae]|uniref:hypothetical protein n=1 Tax=Paenibacillus gorillae TaxID=1243662 RepID=UPI0006943FB3|nr:hypothetical protein [Paenibacillus gorillae]